MAQDVYINLEMLNEVEANLADIVEEFNDATKNSEELEGAIDDPFGDSTLRSKARDFEERWDNKRDQLKDSLDKVREHVAGVVTEVQSWDAETAIALTPEE